MHTSTINLFDTNFDTLLNQTKNQAVAVFDKSKIGFNKREKESLKNSIFDQVKIKKYPVFGHETPKAEILTTTENEAYKLINGLPMSMNNRAIDLRHIEVTVQFDGDISYLYYTGNEPSLRYNASVVDNAIKFNFYVKKTTNDDVDKEIFVTQKNNLFHHLKVRMETEKMIFEDFVETLKKFISSIVDKYFEDLDEGERFTNLLK